MDDTQDAPDTAMIRPFSVDAVQFDGSSTSMVAVQKWIDGEPYVKPGLSTRDIRVMKIETPDGTIVEVQPHDWIIKGPDGFLHPCKPDVFEHREP